jgi:hypothetical protein
MRTCEESLAFRALVSPPHLRRQLPCPALPPMAVLAPAEQLCRLLATLDSPRPLYRRLGQQALESGNAERIAFAITTLQIEIEFCRTDRAKFNACMGRPATASYG